ncbi:MAG TPA: PLP-dependent aminotransferase family protein [Candidatus Limnocylindrales bacterium]
MRYPEVLTFPIALRRDAALPLREQIVEQIAAAVDGGTAQRGARVPSTRTLAGLLGVSRGVVGEAYDLLHSRGYLVTRPGSGTYVAGTVVTVPVREAVSGTPEWDFTPGRLCGEAFPIRAWRAAWRHASHHVPDPVAPPPLGMPGLRRAIAAHLAQTRGIVAPGHEIVVTSGVAAGLRLVLDVLGGSGGAVAVERPISPELLRPSHPLAGFADLPGEVRVAVVCPDGSRPLGTVMTARMRADALAWARDGGMLVEVARDAIFLSGAAGLPRLQPNPRTVTVGGFCELLTPALKLGYALVPRGLAGPIAALIALRGEQPPDLTQLAVARLLTGGTMVRQMHRLTNLYAAKRAIVAGCVETEPGEAGTALIRFSDPAVPEALRRNNIKLPTLDAYGVAEQALVLGFGHLPDKALRKGLAHLVSSLERSTPKEK